MNLKTLQKSVGEALREERELAGYAQEEFAKLIKMHRTYYSAIERGEKNLTVGTLKRICDGLGVSMSSIMKSAVEK